MTSTVAPPPRGAGPAATTATAPIDVAPHPYDAVRLRAVREVTGGLDRFPITQQRQPQYHDEAHGAAAVRYLLDETARAPYELRVEGGRFRFRASGEWLDTRRASRGAGRAIGVLAPDGRLYACAHFDEHRLRHSSFLAGAPVAAGFTLTAVEGRLLATSRRTGHYRTPPAGQRQFIRFINALGVDGHLLVEPLEIA